MTHSISIVLPNYNGRHLLEKNIPSLLEAIGTLHNEIIVVDDCSTDDSVAFLENTYPDIKVIRNDINLGFSSTCNKGIRAATLELLCVVNTDVTFTHDYFTNMIDEFDAPSLFAVKGDIINYGKSYDDVLSIDKTTLLYYKRGFLRFDTKNPLTNKTLLSADSEQFIGLGCCFVCNRKMILELGGFDEIYSPFYWEDCDLGQRALENGYKLLYLPESKVYHQASSTIGNYRRNSERRLISNRNKFIFTWNHLEKNKLWLSHVPITVINILTRWITLDWKYYTALILAVTRQLTFNR